jgi:predicted TIM-barrel fold metal-dependent hydrolase
LIPISIAVHVAVSAIAGCGGSSSTTSTTTDRILATQFFDTALIGDAPELQALAAMTLTDHVLFGTDWPFAARLFAAKGDPQPQLSDTFANAQRHDIDRRNARAAFPRIARAVPK